jgi:molybdopterin molybdotransferase
MDTIKKGRMIRQEDAIANMLQFARIEESEHVDLDAALNRILAEDVISDMDMPPFNKSAMDGFACRLADIDQELVIIETIPAGKSPLNIIGPGQCSRIMTGAPVPEGADCVIMIEDSEVMDSKVKILHPPGKSNICYLGEDIKKGEIVLRKGTQLKPQHISVLAAVGHIRPMVSVQPLVTVIISGDEIVEPFIKPENSKIRNSNGYQVLSQLTQNGCRGIYKGIVSDEITELKKTIMSSLEQSKVLIITGGASKGDYDLVPHVIHQLGFRVHFTEVAIQPGKPFNFSTRGDRVCFGLSGNPVSSFVQFQMLVKPFIDSMLGKQPGPSYLKIPLGEKISRKKAEREYFFPVGISEESFAIPLVFHGSAHINALANAYGLASMAIGKTKIEKGEPVNVRPV